MAEFVMIEVAELEKLKGVQKLPEGPGIKIKNRLYFRDGSSAAVDIFGDGRDFVGPPANDYARLKLKVAYATEWLRLVTADFAALVEAVRPLEEKDFVAGSNGTQHKRQSFEWPSRYSLPSSPGNEAAVRHLGWIVLMSRRRLETLQESLAHTPEAEAERAAKAQEQADREQRAMYKLEANSELDDIVAQVLAAR